MSVVVDNELCYFMGSGKLNVKRAKEAYSSSLSNFLISVVHDALTSGRPLWIVRKRISQIRAIDKEVLLLTGAVFLLCSDDAHVIRPRHLNLSKSRLSFSTL